jgi:hypothetical protein
VSGGRREPAPGHPVAHAADQQHAQPAEGQWKTAEILILRHQLTVLQRRQPRRPETELGGPDTPRDPLGLSSGPANIRSVAGTSRQAVWTALTPRSDWPMTRRWADLK